MEKQTVKPANGKQAIVLTDVFKELFPEKDLQELGFKGEYWINEGLKIFEYTFGDDELQLVVYCFCTSKKGFWVLIDQHIELRDNGTLIKLSNIKTMDQLKSLMNLLFVPKPADTKEKVKFIGENISN